MVVLMVDIALSATCSSTVIRISDPPDPSKIREEDIIGVTVQRNILSDKPRVTKFPINFHPENNENAEKPPPPTEDPPQIDETGEGQLASPDHVQPERGES
ncbi:hypothetical protein K1719_022818 [Acacia pycnantha]|nr:hypothetical protein K1719_022818 [Acacia pycnantha]